MTATLLTGGTGFVGGHLRTALQKPVILLGRKKPELLPNEEWRRLDMQEPAPPEKLAGGEVLCHLAYSMQAGKRNVAYNHHLLEAVNVNRSVRRVVLMSSISVYGENRSPVVDEESACEPIGEYPETKLACEMVWREGLRDDCELLVLRPAEIIGVGGEGMLALIQDALHRPIVGAIKRSVLHERSLHYVAVDKVVAATLFGLQHRQDLLHEIFIVSDDHRPANRSYAVMQDLVRKLAGRRPLPGPRTPLSIARMLGRITGRPIAEKMIFDSRKLHAAGFEASAPLEEEVRRLVYRCVNA